MTTEAQKIWTQRYRENHPDRIKAQREDYYKRNADRMKANAKVLYQKKKAITHLFKQLPFSLTEEVF
jgi:hypothetical protein